MKHWKIFKNIIKHYKNLKKPSTNIIKHWRALKNIKSIGKRWKTLENDVKTLESI